MDQNPKQLIAEKLRNSGSFLITVSKSPSVDQLASALGLSLMLAALNKHATTVFSGEIPNTMEFLEPEKLIDPSVDSLRDFIISISKDKADKLRYKVEDDVVKIYITPYKGKIDENDLKFSQGDLMVDAVIALGVMKRDELDSAISNHGKILHDAAILTITAGKKESSLGSVNWNDENASSISEMLVSISEALQGNLLDAQMATAFLTGIVSATDRFSNKKTSPKVMTMAAQLMAAGANQQLIATNLELDHIDHGVPAHENESVDVHEDEKSETDDESGQENKTDDKQQQPPENQSNGTDSSGDVKQEVASDASLSLKEIENKLHAHEDELSKHDSMPIDKNIQPPAEQHHEDPAIEALEDEIDHDPVENLRNIEESIHPGQTSFRTAASPPPQPVAPPQTAQQTPPTFQMPQNQSPQQPQEQFQGQPQQQPFPEQTQPSTQAPQQQFPQSTQSMNIPQSAPPSQYPQSMQQEQEAQQPAPPPQPQPETRQRVEEPPQAMQQEQQVSRQITGMQQAHDPLESRQPRRVFGTDDSDEPALQYGNQNMEPLTHSQIGGVKGQGPKQTFEAPALGGTFNATSNEAQKESEKQMNGDINNELLSHRRAQQQDQQPQEQSGDMLSQARQEVEQAVQSSPSPVGETPTSIQPQPIPGATQGPGEIAIDESGTFNLNASQPPSAPPPLPPNPQMNSPQPQANQPPPPPTSPMTPPPPGNVGQMYIPPQQPNSRPNEAQENPFNL